MVELETLFDKKEIGQILKRIPELIDYQKSYEKVKYLTNLNIVQEQEMFLYEIYSPIMKLVATSFRPFTDFSPANHDTLTRFKWRWLATKVSDD